MNPVGATPAHKPNYVRPSDMHVLSSQCHLGGSPCVPVIALADYEQVCRERDALTEALKECEDYFDNRADVNDGSYGEPVPNTEMRLLEVVRKALKVSK